VYRSQSEIVAGGGLPQPLQELGELIETKLSEAPGGKGTEIAARLRSGDPSGAPATLSRITGSDPRQSVRRALRESKQLLEAGEVIRLDPKPEGNRPRTPGGALVDLTSKRAMGEGVL
jgi:hypothetical protein